MEFSGRENISPCTQTGECPHHREVPVCFCRIEHLHPGVPLRQGFFISLELLDDPVFAGHIQWRSIRLRKGNAVNAIDMEMAVFYAQVVGEFHRPSLRMRSIASRIRATGRVIANLTYPSPPEPNPIPGVATIPASFSSFAENAMQSFTGIQM